MEPVQLNRKLVLEERAGTPDGAGGFVTGWVSLGTLWGNVSSRVGGGIAHDEVAASRTPYRIIVRAVEQGAPSRPKPGQRFTDGTRHFAIKSVADHDSGRHYLMIYAEEEVAA